MFSTATSRANKAGAGAALDLVGLAAGRAAMMRQRSLDGMPFALGKTMRLLVGPALALPARQLTVPVAADQVSRENVLAGMIDPVVEPLIPLTRWYLLADPRTAQIYIYGYLDGSDTPRVGTEPIQGVDGVQISVVFDFGVGAVD